MTANPLSQKLLDLIDETIEELPLDEKETIARMDRARIEAIHEGFSRCMLTKIDDDPEDLHDAVNEIQKRLRNAHGLRIIK